MHILLLLLALFIPAACFSATFDIEKHDIEHEKAIVPALIWAIGAAVFSVIVGVYQFLQMRKMQKKNKQEPNQLDGTICDEGTKFYDIAGSPHVYGNMTDIWDQSTEAIKQKGGKK